MTLISPSHLAYLELRQKILHAANILFRENSYSSCSIEAISQEVGVSKKTLYKVFAGKEAILQAIVDEITTSVTKELNTILSDNSKSFVDKLDSYISFLYEMHKSTAQRDMLLDIQRHAPAVWTTINEHRNSRVCSIIEFFQSGLKEGSIRSDLNIEIITMIYLNTITHIMDYRLGTNTSTTEPAELYRIFAHMFYTGILTVESRSISAEERIIPDFTPITHKLSETGYSEHDRLIVFRILEQSRILFFQFGFNRVTMDEVSAEVGISKKTLYKYFQSKEVLLESVFSQFLENTSELHSQISTQSIPSFVCCIHGFVNHITKVISSISPQFVKDMIWKSPELWKVIHARRTAMIEGAFTNMISDGGEIGAITTLYTPELTARIYRMVIDSVLNPDVISNTQFSIGEIYKTVVQVMFYGILTEPCRTDFDKRYSSSIDGTTLPSQKNKKNRSIKRSKDATNTN